MYQKARHYEDGEEEDSNDERYGYKDEDHDEGSQQEQCLRKDPQTPVITYKVILKRITSKACGSVEKLLHFSLTRALLDTCCGNCKT